MIQRLQTLFLLLTALIIGVFPFIPIWNKTIENGDIYIFIATGLKHITATGNLINKELFPYFFLALLAFGSAILTLINIFLFNNRILQIKLGKLNILIMFVILISIFILSYIIQKDIGKLNFDNLNYGMLFIIFPIFSNIIANYYIKKDEELVRSANRLR